MSEIESPDPKMHGVDRARLTFSQAQGYEELPHPLRLEEISYEARLRIWDLIYQNCISHVEPINYEGETYIVDKELHFAWYEIFKDMHSRFLLEPIDSLTLSTDDLVRSYKPLVLEDLSFNRLFDLLQMIMREPMETEPDQARHQTGHNLTGRIQDQAIQNQTGQDQIRPSRWLCIRRDQQAGLRKFFCQT